MCMQDLAISARITWRPILNIRESGVLNWLLIPTNPLRVAIAFGDINDSPRALSLTPSGAGPFIGLTRNINTAQQVATATVTILEFPGIFNQDLFVSLGLAFVTAWEGVMDSDLSKAVQAENVLISSKGG